MIADRNPINPIVAITAVISMVTIIGAGHSGAARAWEQYANTSVDGG